MPITLTRKEMTNKLQAVFPVPQTEALVDIFDDIRQAELQRATDTLELKEGLAELARQVNKLTEAQKHTDERVAVFEQRTDEWFAKLAEAQTKTDQALRRLEQAVEKGFMELRREVGRLNNEHPSDSNEGRGRRRGLDGTI